MNDLIITRTSDIPALMSWRMEVLHCVFSLPETTDTAELERSNRDYYERHLADGSHIACIVSIEGDGNVGCGGICLYDEMPSPDNKNGHCAYLMNIYVKEKFRGRGIAKRMVRWLVGQALARGITKIYLETSDAGRKLYGEMGFCYMKDMMKLEL